MQWQKEKIKIENNSMVDAQVPIIISASRSTDIPAFYGDWFVSRWENGYIKWTNPFNGQPLYISFKNTSCVVFWSKNPKTIMKQLDWCDK